MLASSENLLVCFVALGESQLVCRKARLIIKKKKYSEQRSLCCNSASVHQMGLSS